MWILKLIKNWVIKYFDNNKRLDKDIHLLCLELYRTYSIVGGMPEVVKTYLEEQKIISAFDSIPVQLAKDNQKFQYKVI